MQSSPFGDSQGTMLEFPMKPTKRVGDPNFPVETALRMGVPISTQALLMGKQEYTLPAQSALLNPDAVKPSGMYTVRTSSLSVPSSTQNGGVLPQMARMWGAAPTSGPVLLEPRDYVARGDDVFRKPYLTPGESKKEKTSGRAHESIEKTVRQTRSGLAEMSARYGTQMLPEGHSYGDQASFAHHQQKGAEVNAAAKAAYLDAFAKQYHSNTHGNAHGNTHGKALGASGPQNANLQMRADAYGAQAHREYMATTPFAHDGRGILTTQGPPVPSSNSSYGTPGYAPPGGSARVNPMSAQDPAYAYADQNPFGTFKVEATPTGTHPTYTGAHRRC